MNRDDAPHRSQAVEPEAREENWVLDWLNDPVAPTETASSHPVTLTDDLVPLSEDGRYVPHHLDAGGTTHWFSIVEVPVNANPNGELYQMRYFRAAHNPQRQIVLDSYPVMPLSDRERSSAPLPTLQIMLEDSDLENAQQLAYGTAQLHGMAFPDPSDLPALNPRAETVTVNEPIRADSLLTSTTQDEPDAAVERFRAQFADSAFHLLEPIHPIVNYSFETLAVDPYTLELSADKWWHDEQGQLMYAVQPLKTYSLEFYEFEREIERERGAMDAEALRRTYQEEGLEAAMRKAEAMTVANDALDANRSDGRLFPEGPPDRFTTLRESELGGIGVQPHAIAPIDIIDDDNRKVPAVSPEPGSWEELLQGTNADEIEVERHYWQLRVHPALTPDGTPLGYALFCTEFPELPPNFDEHVAEFGMDDSIYPTLARTVEMADFKTEGQAKAFSDEFCRYVIPGLIDGPELASDVAKLEGLSGEWEAMDFLEIVDYMTGGKTVTREHEQWHLHRPDEERPLSGEMHVSLFDIDF